MRRRATLAVELPREVFRIVVVVVSRQLLLRRALGAVVVHDIVLLKICRIRNWGARKVLKVDERGGGDGGQGASRSNSGL